MAAVCGYSRAPGNPGHPVPERTGLTPPPDPRGQGRRVAGADRGLGSCSEATAHKAPKGEHHMHRRIAVTLALLALVGVAAPAGAQLSENLGALTAENTRKYLGPLPDALSGTMT